MRNGYFLLPWLATALIASGASAADDPIRRSAWTNARPGLWSVVAPENAEDLAGLPSGGTNVIHILVRDAATAGRWRADPRVRGLGERVSVEDGDFSRALPYADDLVDALIAPEFAALHAGGLSAAEVWRVLAPLGSAWVKGVTEPELRREIAIEGPDGPRLRDEAGWLRIDKPYPHDMDAWSHYFHDAANTVDSHDARVGWPDQLRFVAGRPFAGNLNRWCSGLTSAGGRNFYASPVEPGDAAPPAAKTLLECRDAFNGLRLWRRFLDHAPLHMHWSVIGYSADAQRVYVTYDGGFAALSAATGADAWRVSDADGDRLNQVAVTDDVVVRDGRSVRAFEAGTGRLMWRLDTEGRRASVAIDEGKVFAALSFFQWRKAPVEIVCAGLKDGQILWRRPLPEEDGAERFTLYDEWQHPLQCRDGRLFFTCRNDGKGSPAGIAAFAAADGKLLWQGKRNSGQPLSVTEDKVWDQLTTYDPATGKTIAAVTRDSKFRGSCGVAFPSARFLIAGRLGFTDRQTGETREYQLARGGCTMGAAIPANGLANFTRHTCTCYSMLRGDVSFASDVPGRSLADVPAEARIARGPAFGKVTAPPEPDDAFRTWPTFRHDAARGAATDEALPDALSIVWSAPCPADVTAPVVDRHIVCTASRSTHAVTAFSVTDGRLLWTFTAGGPVDSPPTLADGYAVFGCADGRVYALRAADGVLAWRYEAAPAVRRIVSFDELESSWPVCGSVIVEDGVVFACAGRHTQVDGGLRVCAIDLATGAERWARRAGTRSRKEAYLNDVLRSDGPRVYLTGFMDFGPQGKFGFDRATGTPWQTDQTAKPKGPILSAVGGLLVDGRYRICTSMNHTEVRRVWWYAPNVRKAVYPSTFSAEIFPMNPTNGYRGDLIAFSANRVFGCARTYGHFKNTQPPQVVTPDPNFPNMSSGQSKLVIYGAPALDKPLWSFEPQRSAFDLRAFVAARNRVIAAFAAPPPAEPDARLVVLDATGGRKTADIALPAAPRWDGMAVAGGRLYVACEDGHILCLDGKGDATLPH